MRPGAADAGRPAPAGTPAPDHPSDSPRAASDRNAAAARPGKPPRSSNANGTIRLLQVFAVVFALGFLCFASTAFLLILRMFLH